MDMPFGDASTRGYSPLRLPCKSSVCDLLRAPMPERFVRPAHQRLKSLIAEL